MLSALLYFCIGFIQDFLVARYTKCTCQGMALQAANTGTLISILSVFVWGEILINRNIPIGIGYFCGLWLGTYIATKLNS
jgi:hypothetical protein